MKHHLYSTSHNLIIDSPKITPYIPNNLETNISSNLNKSPKKHLGFQNQQQSELNNYFPYHIFNKVPNLYNNDNDNKKINISKQITIIDKSIVNDENYLQKIWNDDINEYAHKLKYGQEFFITFAKKKKEALSNKSSQINKKKEATENMINRRFKKNLFTIKSKKTRMNFYDIIINETQKTSTPNKKEKVVKDKNPEISDKKILNTSTFRNTSPKKKYFIKDNINICKTQENQPHNKSRIKDSIKTSSNITNFRNNNSSHYLKFKKKTYDLSKLKFPYFPEIVDNNKFYRYNKKLKLKSISKD